MHCCIVWNGPYTLEVACLQYCICWFSSCRSTAPLILCRYERELREWDEVCKKKREELEALKKLVSK